MAGEEEHDVDEVFEDLLDACADGDEQWLIEILEDVTADDIGVFYTKI